MAQIKHIESGHVTTVALQPVFVGGIWECGDQRFTDLHGDQYEPLPEVFVPPTVSRVRFKMLWTSAERIATAKLRTTNETVDDFWALLEDPEATEVVMALPSVQRDIEITLQAIKDSGVSIDVQARKAQILAGELQ